MSRLLESSLTGKISNILVESDIQGQMLSKELEREVPCLRKLIYKDSSELKYALDGDLDKECEKKIYDIAKSRGFDCDIDIDGAYVFITYSESNVNESEEVKPIEKTREELIRDHGTDDVDLINAGKEPEERVALKETEGFVNELDAIADFMIDFDKPGFDDSYDGDYDNKRDKLIQDIVRDRKTVAYYLNDVVVEGLGTEEQQAEAKRLLGAADLEGYLKEEVEVPTEELNKELEKEIEDKKKAIEERIAEIKLAIDDGVSEDEKAEMEKEIADLEGQLNEGAFKDKRDELVKCFNAAWSEAKFLQAEMRFSKPSIEKLRESIPVICDNLDKLGELLKSVDEEKLEEGEDSQGALKAFSDGLTEAIRLQELRNPEEMGEFFQEAIGVLRSTAEENGYMVESNKLNESIKESVSVATTDGSTVDTQDAASVQSDNGTVTVVTGDTTVVINNTPAEPALDIPVEEPIEEVPNEEIIDEPVEEIPTEEVPVEEPVEDEVIEESDDEYGIDANVDAKSLAVLKNQGITYMLQIEETSGKTTYWVCDNFNAETNEGDNAEVFTEKEKADEEYFKRVGLEPTVEEE